LLDDDAHLDMVLWRTLVMLLPHFMEDVAHFMEVVGALMMRIGPCDDLACLLTPSTHLGPWMLHFGARHCTMSLTCHLEMVWSPWMTLHPLEDVEVWFDDMACDDDSTPLGRGHGSLSLDDIIP
jgi:hypothetical protein